MESVRFNVFQRVLRQWDVLHPYNAAQVLHLAGPADVDLLAAKWNESLRVLGIGGVHVSGKRYWIDSPGEAPEPLCVPGDQTLEAFMSDQMNRPFAPTGTLPFRPFVIQQKGSYLAGVVYHHWIADRRIDPAVDARMVHAMFRSGKSTKRCRADPRARGIGITSGRTLRGPGRSTRVS